MKSSSTPKRRGRRTGDSGTREAILAAARERFGARGYAATRMRDIADDAGVDPALVHYFFGTKDALFAAALELPYNPAELIAGALAGDPDAFGDRLATALVEAWSRPGASAAIAALLRAAVAHEPTATVTREFIETVMIPTLASAAAPDHAELRAAQAASQIIGFMFSRYVFEVAPASTVDLEEVAPRLGALVHHTLRG